MNMRFTPSSPPFSSPATSSTTFNDNFCADKPFISSCLSGFLRRFFMSRTLPTYPSDQINEEQLLVQDHNGEMGIQNHADQGSATPTIVARLMGLDSMPEVTSSSNAQKNLDSTDWVPETMTADQNIQHRRTKTSVSFREMPTYFELQDDDFFILDFGNGDTRKKLRSRNVNSETSVGKGRRRRRKGGRNRVKLKNAAAGDDGIGRGSAPNNHYNKEEMLRLRILGGNSYDEVRYNNVSSASGIAGRRKKISEYCIADRKVEVTECDPENYSPVSVLDHCEFNDLEVATSSEEDSKLQVSRATRKVSSEILCQDYPSDYSNSITDPIKLDTSEPDMANEGRQFGKQQRVHQRQKHFDMLNHKICRLAESEVAGSCVTYGRIWKNKEWEDVAATFGHYIFDQLVNEFVDQLLKL